MTTIPPRIRVIGSLNLDTTYRVEHVPGPGETLTTTAASTSVGGKGANQAIAVARAGAPVSMAGRVGADSAGAAIRQELLDAGIDLHDVLETSDHHSGMAAVIVEPSGENRIIVGSGANHAFTVDDVMTVLAHCHAHDVVVLQNELHPDTTRAAAGAARAGGAYVIWNAAPAPATPDAVITAIDMLIVNEHELRALALLRGIPDADPRQLIAALATDLAVTVICTLGAEGVLLADDLGLEHVPARRVQVVDTTAAGDTFVGYLAANLLLLRRPLTELIRIAVHAASLTVTRHGASPSIPHRDDVDAITDDPTPEGMTV